ncbi:uncharacterized protein K441DRAFT_679318 [Cenococcum geophilum 1.58]|uniref:uncharacterized protein n=1 Tax=Cenococcum geophilum 1.58 TaxID=794803 RepID=UPI00358FD071|nr:hypothetical protein K441DRAFT_679318 [Cenococcum geophilum 1.58]
MSAPHSQSGTPALDNLQAMVNLVFMQTGRYFKDPVTGNSAKSQYGMKRAIPAALERFHDSLDELENELTRAKMVTRRDFAVLQADREKREQAEAAERKRIAAESCADKGQPAQGNSEDGDTSKDVDVAMTDEAQPAQANRTKIEAIPVPENTLDKSSPSAKPTGTAPSQPSHPAPLTTTAGPPADDLFDPLPTTANTDSDFDAMFNDHRSANQDTDAPANPASPLNLTLDDEPSLLRGLEDFANSTNDNTASNQTANLDETGDFNMLDLPTNTNTATNNSGQPDLLGQAEQIESGIDSQYQNSQTQQQHQGQDDLLDTLPTDSNFEDLFNLEYENPEYGNPEGTEFEDAFFGFGEN